MTDLRQALLGAAAVLIVVLAPAADLGPLARGLGLFGLWLCVVSLISYFGPRLPQSASAVPRQQFIPLRFSGPTGRFELRPRGDGRRVEVMAGPEIVAEVIASNLRDEIVLHVDAVPEDELPHLGSAVGQAIEMAAAADEDAADS